MLFYMAAREYKTVSGKSGDEDIGLSFPSLTCQFSFKGNPTLFFTRLTTAWLIL